MAGIIQQDAWSNNNSFAPWTQIVFGDGQPGQKDVTAGNAILVFWAGLNANTLSSITDNYGNTYSKIAGASKNDSSLGYDGEWWIATNVAAVTYPVGPKLALTFTYAGSATTQVGFWVLEISGVNSATQVTGTASIDDTTDANYSGPSLNGGSVGAIYLVGLSGFAENDATVNSPWSIETVLQELLAPTVATLVSTTGTQQPTFTPGSGTEFLGVACGLAFTGLYLPAPVIPSTLDSGHIYDQVLYFGTLTGWGGRTGVLTPDPTQGDTPFPVVHSGEAPSARAHINDFTFTPVNGQRVACYMVRDSAGDKIAVLIQPK